MRHRTRGRKLGRNSKHRKALYRNLVTSLVEHERIETTAAKAKELKGLMDKIISLGKQGSLHARRHALQVLQSKAMVAKLFDDVAKRFQGRPGGYTRIIPTRRRPGDAAELVAIEFVERSQPSKSPQETSSPA